ncbi:hypothetical protein MD484_g3744, partial [Candolleomyces efflorescens]
MEAAIRTPEILEIIFHHLRSTNPSDLVNSPDELYLTSPKVLSSMRSWAKERTTLLNAGLACRAFFGPAMANLWWCVDGIFPFVRLLPGVRWKRSNQGGYHLPPLPHPHYHLNPYPNVRQWELSTDIQEEDLTRFDFYAKQVTHIVDLSLNSSGSSLNSSSSCEDTSLSYLLVHLAELRPSSTCFPNLQSVHTTTSFNLSPLLFYTSPSLQKLHLRGFWSEDKFGAVCGVVHRLARRSSALEALEIPFVPTREAVGVLTAQLHNLRYLCMRQSLVGSSMPFGELVDALAALPRLEKLAVNCSVGVEPGAPSGIGGGGGGGGGSTVEPGPGTEIGSETGTKTPWFPSLVSTTLEGTPANILTVLSHLHSTPLLELGIKVCWNQTMLEEIGGAPLSVPEEISQLTTYIHRHFHSTLRSVSVEYQSGRVYISPGVGVFGGTRLEVPLEAIRPLVSGFPGLQTLFIDRSICVSNLISASSGGRSADAFLEEVSETCPGLVKLSIPTSGTLSNPVLFSFEGVKRLVGGLRYLEELRVDFDARSIDITARENGLVASPNLRILDVRSSPIKNKQSVALALARTFPNLETLLYTRGSMGPTRSTKSGTSARWKEVGEWLPVIMGRYGGVNEEYDNNEEGDGSSRSSSVLDIGQGGPQGMIPVPTVYPPPLMIPVTDSSSDSDDSEEY